MAASGRASADWTIITIPNVKIAGDGNHAGEFQAAAAKAAIVRTQAAAAFASRPSDGGKRRHLAKDHDILDGDPNVAHHTKPRAFDPHHSGNDHMALVTQLNRCPGLH
ncbi:hypothetical protein [Sphingomonas lutea]|uniref:hypothetical protein n=1 Tax=Sphingomonas lutea TaxID=1045317 RepID=UPI001F282164|nr:hypothetical protein [Sphingomonas lutea]